VASAARASAGDRSRLIEACLREPFSQCRLIGASASPLRQGRTHPLKEAKRTLVCEILVGPTSNLEDLRRWETWLSQQKLRRNRRERTQGPQDFVSVIGSDLHVELPNASCGISHIACLSVCGSDGDVGGIGSSGPSGRAVCADVEVMDFPAIKKKYSKVLARSQGHHLWIKLRSTTSTTVFEDVNKLPRSRDFEIEKFSTSVEDVCKLPRFHNLEIDKFSTMVDDVSTLPSLPCDIKEFTAAIGICAVGEKKPAPRWKSAGLGKVTIDSGAEESVWPKDFLNEKKTVPTEKVRRFVAANGAPMAHYGEKSVNFSQSSDGPMSSMSFQVSDVTKPLASVARIFEHGNIVQFGSEDGESFMVFKKTGKKIPITRQRGSFIINVEFLFDGASLDFTRQEA
jgi:hypothetical protein